MAVQVETGPRENSTYQVRGLRVFILLSQVLAFSIFLGQLAWKSPAVLIVD